MAGTNVTNVPNSIFPTFRTNLNTSLNECQAKAGFADAEVPTGTINGSNVTFTLAHTPSPAGSLVLVHVASGSEEGPVLVQGTASPLTGGYDLTGATITMHTAPASGDQLVAWYRF